MATVYASNSGTTTRYIVSDWSTTRNNSTGTAASDDPACGRNTSGISVLHTPGRGAQVYGITRSHFYFDTSGITGTVSSATLKIFGYSQTSADVITIKSTAFGGDGGTALATGDYGAIDFSTAYSAELATWSALGYNDITLNATALGDMKNNNAFIVALVEHDHDYADAAVSNATFQSGLYYDNWTGTSADPYIDYTLAPELPGHIRLSGYTKLGPGKVSL